MYLYEDQFSEAQDFPETNYRKVLVIASTPRCGSHMLGHALRDTGAFGFPLEYANPHNRGRWKSRFGEAPLGELIQKIALRRTSPNGVFAIKVHYGHLREFGGFAEFKRLFPEAYYVHLSRRDVLKQAVSFAVAKQTGVWIAGQRPVTSDPKYSFDEINGCLQETLRQNAAWHYQLAANGCRKLALCFEDVASDLGAGINAIASFMDVDLPIHASSPKHATAVQGAQLNQEWARQFLGDFRHGELFAQKSSVPVSLWKRLPKWAK